MVCGSLFSGIGGFDLAAEWMGWQTAFQCEFNPFAQKVLRYYWPDAQLFNDITKTDFSSYENKIDVLTGGFPCQPYSVAGKRKGTADNRHLWPEMLRAIREIKPRWVVGENVRGLVSWDGGLVFEQVCADLESAGYDIIPFILPAASVNAPHRRERVWFIAHSSDTGFENMYGQEKFADRYGFTTHTDGGTVGAVWGNDAQKNALNCNASNVQCTADTSGNGGNQDHRQREPRQFNQTCAATDWQDFPTQSPVCGGDDGLPAGLDNITFSAWRNKSIQGYGNAIVPQVALQIFKAIERYEILY